MNKRIRQKKRITGHTFSKKDLWNLDSTMAKFCAEGVRQFINMKKINCPYDLSPGQWEDTLKEIYWTLNSIAIQFDNNPHTQNIIKNIEPAFNREEILSYKKRINNGLQLFAKYFCDMWD